VYWLRRPPYLRWIAAGLVLGVGLFLDLRPASMVSYPFLSTGLATGSPVEPAVEWQDVPAGYLPDWTEPVAGIAVADLPPGTPLLPAMVTDSVMPDGWWTVMLPLPRRIAPGTSIRVAVGDEVIEGIVSGEMLDDGYEITGPVAFPESQAAAVAAAASSALVVMIGP
jgi:hypothetical protein